MCSRLVRRRVIPFIVNSRRFASTDKFTKNDELKVDLLSGHDKGILVLSLNRSKGKNSFSRSFLESLESTFETVKYDKNVRTIVLRSLVPGVFCAGADLKERISMSELEVRAFVGRLEKLMTTIEETPVPVIAAINGAALGGGLEMALSCDIRVGTEGSKIGLVETKLGIIPGAGGSQRLSRLIGPSLAKELLFTARILSGTEAKQCGILNHCTSNSTEDTAFDKALDIAREILPNGPIAVKMVKQAVNKGIDVDISTGCTIEQLCYAQVIPTRDRIEGLKAFQEKRKPNYKGE